MENGFPDGDDGIHLWSRILEEVGANATQSQPSSKNLLVLGDVSSGKSALVARLKGEEAPIKGHGLEYHYLDVTDAGREAESRLGIWILDGDPFHQNLLRFALTRAKFADTLVVLVGSAESPWSLIESLQQWTDILSRYVDRLGLDADELREARDSLARQFVDYVEPDADAATAAANAAQQAAAAVAAAAAAAAAAPNAAAAASLAARRAPNPLHPPADPEKVALPLSEGALTCNLGLPVVVVLTKSDAMAGVLEKELDYKEEHFDFLQYHLRCFCLKYGAALVYTSVREDKNCALLRSYLLHRVYGAPCPHAPYVVERDCVFVPAGWDSQAKAYLLAASTGSLTKDLSNTPFSDVIARPPGFAGGVRRAGGSTPGRGGTGGAGGGGCGPGGGGGGDAEQAEDEQVFLSRLQAALLKQSAAPAGGAGGPAPGVGAGPGVGPPGTARSSVGGAGKPGGAATGRLPPGAAGQGASAAAMGANDGVLANFFNSLLSKRSGGAPGQQQPSPAAGASPGGGAGGSAPAKMQQQKSQDSPADANASLDSPSGGDGSDGGPVKRVGPPTPAQS